MQRRAATLLLAAPALLRARDAPLRLRYPRPMRRDIPVRSLPLDASINEAAEAMLAQRIRHLVVNDAAGHVVGVIDEHELRARRVDEVGLGENTHEMPRLLVHDGKERLRGALHRMHDLLQRRTRTEGEEILRQCLADGPREAQELRGARGVMRRADDGDAFGLRLIENAVPRLKPAGDDQTTRTEFDGDRKSVV